MNKQEAVQRIKADLYKATEVLAELAAVGRIRAPESESVEELRREMSDHAGEWLEEHWVSFDAPTEPLADDDAGDGDGDGEG